MIIAYLRVSTDEQANSGLGMEAQLEAIRKAVGTPDSVYRDEGYSGSKANRPALQEALQALKPGDVLAVAKRDRLARDTFLALWCEKEAKRRKATIVSADGTGNGDDPASELFRTLVDAFATYERQLIGQRTKVALQVKKQRGEKTGGHRPYGTIQDGSRLKENPDEVTVLDTMLELRSEGATLSAICCELQDKGIPTATGLPVWQPMTISRMINSYQIGRTDK